MPLVSTPEGYAIARELLRQYEPQLLVRHCPASAEDYEQLTDEDLKCEFVDGELIVHSPATLRHEDLTSFINALVRLHLGGKLLGTVFGSNAVMQLGERRFSPDVSVLLAAHSHRIQDQRMLGPADLAVEVLSRSTGKYDRETKLPAYREGGVGEIWLVDAERREFEAHWAVGAGYKSANLTSGPFVSTVLPGLTIQVPWFWCDPLPSLADCQR